MTVALITVPYTSTGMASGEAGEPAVLRNAGMLEALRSAGDSVTDLGDVSFGLQAPERDPVSGIIAPGTLLEMVRETRRIVTEALNRGLFLVVVGGECSFCWLPWLPRETRTRKTGCSLSTGTKMPGRLMFQRPAKQQTWNLVWRWA